MNKRDFRLLYLCTYWLNWARRTSWRCGMNQMAYRPRLQNLSWLNPASMICWSNIGLLLAHRLWLWPNSKPMLGQCLMLAGKVIIHGGFHAINFWCRDQPGKCLPSKHGEFTKCCFNVGPPSSTLAQHWNSIRWMPHVFWINPKDENGKGHGSLTHPCILTLTCPT